MAEWTALPDSLLHLVEAPRPCSYLPSETAALEYRIFASLSPIQLESLISRGWRRFGMHIFRPRCAACTQCHPIRVDVRRFEPSRSQRKTRRRNEHIAVTLHRPSASEEHIGLYNAWHQDMSIRRGWPEQQTNEETYAREFLAGRFASSWEMQYRENGKLLGVGLIDILERGMSSAYFYHAPEWRSAGPGTYSLLCELELAQRRGLSYHYLGYWIPQCPSMSYKNRFHPHELLQGRPDDQEIPDWRVAEITTD